MRANMKELSEGLRQKGYRFTRQRRIILEEVRRQQYHPSAKEVYDAVKVRLPNISLGTVYRSLGVLVDLGSDPQGGARRVRSLRREPRRASSPDLHGL